MPRGTGEDAEGLNMGAIELLDLCETVAFVRRPPRPPAPGPPAPGPAPGPG